MMLETLITDLGECSTYDAVSQCSRCGYCEQACPTYVATGREAFSGRGRNQVVRLLLEGKFDDPKAAEEALSTCLLCGACTAVCPAHVPTADLVLEGRRKIAGETPPLVKFLTDLLIERPARLAWLLKAAYFLKRLGLASLAARLGLLRRAGLAGLEQAALRLQEAPLKLLCEELRQDWELQSFAGAGWVYFAACGPNYILPRIGLATVKVLKALVGPGAFLDNPCCGLLCYNYGELDKARVLAQAVIARWEAAGSQAPVVADCSSCAAYLKSYPQLFPGDQGWKERAQRFSGRVKDFLEVLPAEKIPMLGLKATYHDSCRALNAEGIAREPRRALKAAAGGLYRELPEANTCCGGAGAFAFLHPELSDQVLRRKVANVASVQARWVAVSSTSCLLQLADGLKKYYPECGAMHLSEVVARALESHPEVSRSG